jgi:hypothetical protein
LLLNKTTGVKPPNGISGGFSSGVRGFIWLVVLLQFSPTNCSEFGGFIILS